MSFYKNKNKNNKSTQNLTKAGLPSARGNPSKALQISDLGSLKNWIRQEFAHERDKDLKDVYHEYRDNLLADYIYGIFHPDIVFKENLDIKSPSYLPIPTTTFRFREVNTITTNSYGNFVIFWQPNYLGSQIRLKQLYDNPADITYYNLMVNTSPNLRGNTSIETGWTGIPFRKVTQEFQKYRLTSACIKVMYTGKVLDQSGMIAASATYKKGYRVIGYSSSTITTDRSVLPPEVRTNLSSMGDFDTIRQGQWAKNISIVDQPDGLTCVYYPTDPLNQVFVDDGLTIDHGQISQSQDSDTDMAYTFYQPANANISYSICGYGLPVNSTCITVETYYNYEIIVKQEQMPYFTPKVTNHQLTKYKEVLSTIGGMVSSSGLISSSRDHDNRSIWSKVRAAFQKAGTMVNNIYPYIGPLIKALV